MNENQLLCTFTSKHLIISTLQSILETYLIVYNKIFIYENEENAQQFLCTYNIDGVIYPRCYLPNTISVHRKKQTNTLYSINALNELIKENNNGVLDTKFIIDWDKYKDYAFLIADGQLRRIKLRFREVFFIKKPLEC